MTHFPEKDKIIKILVADKDKAIYKKLYAGVSVFEYDVGYAPTQDKLFELMNKEYPHLLVLDYDFGGGELLADIRRYFGNVPVALLLEADQEKIISETKDKNIYSYILKTRSIDDIIFTIKKEAEKVKDIKPQVQKEKVPPPKIVKKYKPGKVKILVVDDRKANCELLQKMLVLRGYEVYPCWNSEDAMTLFAREKPDIVILDLVMPKLDGMEILRRIKELKTKAKVFILTGVNDPLVVKDAVAFGADDFIMKPFSVEQVYATIVKHLSAMYKGYTP